MEVREKRCWVLARPQGEQDCTGHSAKGTWPCDTTVMYRAESDPSAASRYPMYSPSASYRQVDVVSGSHQYTISG